MQLVSSIPPPLEPPVDGEAEPLPRAFGRYTLFEHVGRGGMAQIYLAREELELGATRLAVVKRILPAFASDTRFADMLVHEAKLAARLNHRRIAQVFELGRVDGDLYIAMEYVEGIDLNVLLRKCTEKKVGLPAHHALGIVAGVLEGLDYAHRRMDDDGAPLGVVHRDVSPSNILISYEGEVKICDFGIAHARDLVDDGSDALKGKAGYMSPEHARGEAIDARADVFSAGIVLWELLAGRRLYKARPELSLLEQARTAYIPELPERDIPDPARLVKIVERALARDRADRYPTAGAFLRDLEEYVVATGLLASQLKFGEWLSEAFGTELVERRRASEGRLPKSTPPPRSSPPRARTSSIPGELFGPNSYPVSSGAMRAFKKELESSRQSAVPGSLAGAALDVARSSSVGESPRSSSTSILPPPMDAAAEQRKRQTRLLLFVVGALLLVALVRHLMQ